MTETVAKEEFAFKVNGIEFASPHQKLQAHEILELAEKRGAMPGKPEEYILQGEKRQYGWDDTVDLQEDNIFITISNKPTPVA